MDKLKEVVALAKRRGFIFPGSEIYGGLANTYDYGPLGAELLKNLRVLWWDEFVTKRAEIYGLETSVIMSPKVWQASGHVGSFTDTVKECKNCHQRARVDQLTDDKCPNCGASDWTEPKKFNLLFETHIGIVPESQSLAYLRGETAQGSFTNFKNVLDTFSPKLPFGLAQMGKVFRNEVTSGQQVFRTLEFDLAEFEYFIGEKDWQNQFDFWKSEVEKFAVLLGVNKKNLRWRPHTKDELSHYSKRTEDLEYQFPFGFKEWFAVAYRTDFDLKNHMERSGVDLHYTDPDTGKKFIPHVIEPTFGLSRSLLVILTDNIKKDKDRVVLKLTPKLAPYKVAVFPLLANKADLVKKAKKIFNNLKDELSASWDDNGNIGKRYYRQDEAGTPWCVTVDFDSLKDDTVTVRDRDTTKQTRIKAADLLEYFQSKL
ncbi:MAG: Glycine-tRNA ligase [Candidatus Beckwithbacteria bacterium GW2011_GWB1_47_15]|uniref:Glycine-tRNA ligase n=1 Tax=Candidatus Beckwithbacteria bacterium GW2011_GWB1_47_15 TaxID=1618371 RepID=A0A0G1RWJ4_9BACT|nr:MAG: glycyl-tRNA synthetase, glycyl-tRNA synthetase [Candidatus Beckwithbacteria bacterium GW2011_GWC1_49_16]KKU35620.1 MAG: Glycine-tRNA ligase [Candidatus Beckwithbacteria bacterium GW2011_GWA1_46_30]KKU61674.1 MAG: Glycine-tRNA ligase [Candidatus Beckwithbacteria bacterium GW2011_GWB1_47_15]KKU72177.1 MAG: Glycine-tRNA ligase [Candidatus Beckwithbacteria bacterium GW2011_GWA2_47_25]KKW04802.1 MAG: Glycine-tRNA ligase [Candidatus Beckwithbacteria bacterium GW2011_GWC2_49_11]OGD49007.1 MAG